jgi:hypothetical protein
MHVQVEEARNLFGNGDSSSATTQDAEMMTPAGTAFSLNICDDYFGAGETKVQLACTTAPHFEFVEVQSPSFPGKISSCDKCEVEPLDLSATMARVNIGDGSSAPLKTSTGKRSRLPSTDDARVKEQVRSIFGRSPISSSLNAMNNFSVHSPLKKMAVHSKSDPNGHVIEDYFGARSGSPPKPCPCAAPAPVGMQPSNVGMPSVESRLVSLRAKAAKWDQHASVFNSQTVRNDKFCRARNVGTQANEFVARQAPQISLVVDTVRLGPLFYLLPVEVCDCFLAFLHLAPDLLKLCRVNHSFRSMALHPDRWTDVDFFKRVSRPLRSIPKVTDRLVTSISGHASKMRSFVYEGPKSNPLASTSLPARHRATADSQDMSDESRSMDALNASSSLRPNLSLVPPPPPHLLTGNCLQALAFNCKSLETVRLVLPGWGSLHSLSLDGKSVAILLRECLQLQQLVVGPGIRNLTEAMTAEHVPPKLPCMRELSLVQCHGLVDLDVTALANRCCNLQSFRAHPSPLLTNASLSSIAKHCGKSLKSVVVGSDLSNGVGQHSEISDPAVLLARCPSLQHLRLSYCRVNLHSVLRKVSISAARHNCCLDKLHLQYLNLRAGSRPTDDADAEDLSIASSSASNSADLTMASRSIYSTAPAKIVDIASSPATYFSRGAVRNLDIENCALEDLTLNEIVSALPGLEKLHIRSFKAFASTFPELTATGITALSRLRSLVSLELQIPTLSNTTSSVEDVSVTGGGTVDGAMSASLLSCFDKLFRSCSLIRTLHLGFPGFSDEGAACIAKQCHMLEKLKLTECGVTEFLFPILAGGVCRNLKGIVLDSCKEVKNIGDALPLTNPREAPFLLLKLVVLKDSGFVSRQNSVCVSRANCGFVVLHGRNSAPAMKMYDGTWEVDVNDQIGMWKPSVNVLL